ncbi:hypothetical protein ES288_D07G020200v1 [Gossypium darwinii]|uniref:Uncharacterized protein n=1 Tax=Gossypium darwinii TaxID=34276 RepID=A0A5D2BR44_GOSDA|nr:hypothetical protein ES288_D07G020200v1 [Gossypium darwinii]
MKISKKLEGICEEEGFGAGRHLVVVRIADLIYSIDLESYEENRVLGEGLRLIVALKGVEVGFHMAFHQFVNLQEHCKSYKKGDIFLSLHLWKQSSDLNQPLL